ncbi:hypothetical protein PDE_04980 [Penicillium oxalicum 114-2]|uniref:Uncharacterized protein n=1 Tax=Penicillium oxalicum (strain 114-2 / CGMCC 5302) TaxID=933388 RepID=S7ZH76_PENO1|nr:hypothetical protein PDE_04980 [Penicillium oxalicum 114-2]
MYRFHDEPDPLVDEDRRKRILESGVDEDVSVVAKTGTNQFHYAPPPPPLLCLSSVRSVMSSHQRSLLGLCGTLIMLNRLRKESCKIRPRVDEHRERKNVAVT